MRKTRRTRTRHGSRLAQLNELERHALCEGQFIGIAFDDERTYRATWAAVRDELLNEYRQKRPEKLPEALFRIELYPQHGQRIEGSRPASRVDGQPYWVTTEETDSEYFKRHGLSRAEVL